MPPSIAPTFLQLDIVGALHIGILQVVLVFVLVEVFDATGTLIGVAKRAGLLEAGKPNQSGPRPVRRQHRDRRRLAAGHHQHHRLCRKRLGRPGRRAHRPDRAGRRRSCSWPRCSSRPLAGSVPAYATAPALLYVAGLMMRELIDIDWDDITEAAPAALTALAMPFTYSIANGLAFGFISYVVLKACHRPGRQDPSGDLAGGDPVPDPVRLRRLIENTPRERCQPLGAARRNVHRGRRLAIRLGQAPRGAYPRYRLRRRLRTGCRPPARPC